MEETPMEKTYLQWLWYIVLFIAITNFTKVDIKLRDAILTTTLCLAYVTIACTRLIIDCTNRYKNVKVKDEVKNEEEDEEEDEEDEEEDY